MSVLVWGVKQSLLAYVRGMSDGTVATSSGATEAVGVFTFPGEALSFTGAVTLTGHGGMMRVVLADPSIVETDDGWVLELGDGAGDRRAFATIAAFDGIDGTGLALTAAGSDLFAGPYPAGTPLDDLTVRGA